MQNDLTGTAGGRTRRLAGLRLVLMPNSPMLRSICVGGCVDDQLLLGTCPPLWPEEVMLLLRRPARCTSHSGTGMDVS